MIGEIDESCGRKDAEQKQKRALAALKNARIGAEEGERLAEQEIQRSIEQG